MPCAPSPSTTPPRWRPRTIRNREHLEPWEPRRPDAFFTEDGQREAIAGRLRQVELGLYDCWVLWHGTESVGTANLQNIVRGAMQGADVGYWVDPAHLRSGLATAAPASTSSSARRDLGLHRLGASTTVDNRAVAGRAAALRLREYGRIPQFLYLDGAWRDRSCSTWSCTTVRPAAEPAARDPHIDACRRAPAGTHRHTSCCRVVRPVSRRGRRRSRRRPPRSRSRRGRRPGCGCRR